MKAQEHIAYGGAASAVVAMIWGPWNALVFWLASVLIDVDHYLDHIYRTGGADWNVLSIFKLDNYFRKKLDTGEMQKRALCFSLFHTAEVFLAVYVTATHYGQSLLMFVFFGMVFHLFLDLLFLTRYKALFMRALSIVEYMIRKRIMKRRGIDPDKYYLEACREMGIPVRSFENGQQIDTVTQIDE